MEIYERVSGILTNVKPNKDLSQVTDIIEGGYLDSFELMSLIAQLSEEFSVEIGIEDMNPESFNSVQAMVALVERLTIK